MWQAGLSWKEFGTEILISAGTQERILSRLPVRPLGASATCPRRFDSHLRAAGRAQLYGRGSGGRLDGIDSPPSFASE